MSFKADIPTLSANEVYTLTFEYEGTETIQLMVGDLTLETTDRRVVFTTTSPVNYIESNVNLTNLSIYEGYYESDDFGGEYTQESIIEGKNLVNLIQSKKHLTFQNGSCGVTTFEDNMIKLTITDVSSLTSTWQHAWMKTSANLKVGVTYTCVVHVVENSISAGGITVGASHGTLVHGSSSNLLGSGETGTIVFTYTTATATLKDYNGYYDGFGQVVKVGAWQNGSLKYGIMVFEGDYYDYFINSNIPYFEGIGCVKSPMIVSQNENGTDESVLSTPDDLELHRINRYDRNSGKQYPSSYIDTVDLTTGIVNKNYMKIRLNDYLDKMPQNFTIRNHSNLVNYTQIRIDHYNSVNNIFPHKFKASGNDGIFTSTTGIIGAFCQGEYDSWWTPVDGVAQAISNNTYLLLQVDGALLNGVDTTSASALKQWVNDQDFTLIMSCETYTEQLDIKPLKSYCNGSITTSSQQLVPTLKTTLPISNKFTQTNLSSGQTYNIYFEGTATKLDAGGTVIVNPVSPCEVECGGTTLTIEGADIQNVRVLETTVKNEVGNNGTSDVELSSIENSDVNGENIIISELEQPIKLRSLGSTYDSYNLVTRELIKRIGVSETDGSYSVLNSPIVTQVEITDIPLLYKNGLIKIYSNSNIYPTMILEVPTTNKYDTSTWESGVYTQRNITEIYFNDSTTPMTPTEILTLTESHLSSGYIIIMGENTMLIKGDYTGRDIPYFTGMRSVEAIEIETTPSPDQSLFGKGGRK